MKTFVIKKSASSLLDELTGQDPKKFINFLQTFLEDVKVEEFDICNLMGTHVTINAEEYNREILSQYSLNNPSIKKRIDDYLDNQLQRNSVVYGNITYRFLILRSIYKNNTIDIEGNIHIVFQHKKRF